MTKRRRRVLVALAVMGAVAAAIGIGAATLLPGWLHGAAERLASRTLGRELSIAGPLDVSFSLTPRVTARDVRLANAPWGSEPSMARVGRVTVVVELLSLWSGPARVRDLEIENARLLLEADGAGGGNWVMGPDLTAKRPPEPARQPALVLEHVAIRDFELVLRTRPKTEPSRLAIRDLDLRLDPATRMIDLRGGGQLDQAPWEISGRVGTLERLSEGRDVDLALSARLGASTLETRGRIGDLAALRGAQLDLSVDGPDIAAALETFGLRSPLTGAFRLRGRLVPAKDAVGVDFDGGVGAVTARVHGTVDALRSLDAFELAVEAEGPDASVVGSWVGVPGLPRRPFDLSGRVRRGAGRLHLEGGRARVGSTSLAVAGALGESPRLVGTDLTVGATGRDLSTLSRLAGVGLPPGPFEVAGRLLRRAQDLAIDAAELRFGGAVIRVGGTLGEPPDLAGLDLTVDASGPDLSAFSRLATVDLPQRPFALRGRVARHGRAVELDAVEGRLGDDTVAVDGHLVPAKRLEGTGVRLRVAGPDLGRLASLAGVRGGPAEPFDLKGHLRVVPGGYELDGAAGSVGRLFVAAEGRIGAAAGLHGTALSCRARGPALSDLAAWGLPESLPADPFSVEGGLRIEDGVFHAQGVVANVGRDRATVNGALGALPDLSRLDVAIEAMGPSLAGLGRFLAAAGLEAPARVPSAPYHASGRVRRVPRGWELREVRAKAGDAMVRVEGTLGSGRRLADTEIRVEASGPDLATVLGPIAGASRAPAAAFEISADLAGSLERFAATRLAARLGGSDVEGTLSVRLDGRPTVDAALRSRRLDVAELLAGRSAEPAAGATPAAAPKPSAPGRLIPADPLELGALRSVDAALELAVGELAIPVVPLRDVVVAGELRDGALRLDAAEGRGLHGGRVAAGLALEPSEHGYEVTARGRVEGARIVGSMTSPSPGEAPSLDVEIHLRGEGRSLRDLAAGLDGAALAVVGSGKISNQYQLVASGVLAGLLDALNPFRKSSDHTDFECGVAVATVEHGQVALAPIAARTGKVTVVGHGKIDLGTEHVDLEWAIKPRRGVGISPGAITSPYVKLGGTLASPRLEVKPIEAAASTGAAVVTLGLTVLLKGLHDRITAERNVCVDALMKSKGLAHEAH